MLSAIPYARGSIKPLLQQTRKPNGPARNSIWHRFARLTEPCGFKNHYGGMMSDKEFKISQHGIARLSRLRMPLAYNPYQKLTCLHSGATAWTDYGRMRWNKPRTWRVSLRYRSLKPPCTNRGVGHGIASEIYQCDVCKDSFSYHAMAFIAPPGAKMCEDCWNVIPF